MVNYIDIVIIAVVAFFALKGLFKGIISEVLGLAGLFFGLLVATKYMSTAAKFIDQYVDVPPALGSMLGYLVVFVAIQFGVQILIHVLESITDIPFIGFFFKLLGGVVGFIKGGLIVSLVVLLISILPISEKLLPGLEDSRLLPYAREFAPWVYNSATKIIPGSKSFYGEVKESLTSVPTKNIDEHTKQFMQSIADDIPLPESVQRK